MVYGDKHYFSLLVKPVSADCNMECSYCFYLKNEDLYPSSKHHKMSYKVLDKLVYKYMNTEQIKYVFGWQGGEPTLLGLDFFQNVIELQMKYAKAGAVVSNGLQTNATIINNKFAEHLAKYKYLVGVSLDGPEYLHNHYRRLKNKKGSFSKVLHTINILKDKNVEFNILTLVNNINIMEPEKIYDFLKSLDLNYHQYIPCIEYDDNGNLIDYSVNGRDWGNFLIKIFNKWYPDDIFRVSIRLFDSIMNFLLYERPNNCQMFEKCNQYLVVEYNGDVYPCDFYVRKDLKIGNIMENSWDEIIDSTTYKEFIKLKSNYNIMCSSCKYLNLCCGDCLKYRYDKKKNNPKNLSILCPGLKLFYDYSLPFFRQIVNKMILEKHKI